MPRVGGSRQQGGEEGSFTSANQGRYVAVRCDFSMGNLLDCAVYAVVEGFCFIGSRHREGIQGSRGESGHCVWVRELMTRSSCALWDYGVSPSHVKLFGEIA